MSTMTEQTDYKALIPLAATLGIEIDSATKDEVTSRLTWREDLCTTMGVLHGGTLMAFADTVGAVLASLNLPEGALTTTIESKTNFLRAVTSGEVTATTTPIHVGRRTIVVQTHIRNPEGKLVALVTQTQAVITS